MGTIDQQPGSGILRYLRVSENIENVGYLVISQEDNPKRTDRFVRSRMKQLFTD